MENPNFFFAFEITRSIVFEVNYYRLGNNKNKHFATSAAEFNRPKTDYNRCGQAQNDLLKGHSAAMNFFKKWDVKHLHDLTEQEYSEILADIEVLKTKYNWMQSDRDIRFHELKTLSKATITKGQGMQVVIG